jgi:hypothetical protein
MGSRVFASIVAAVLAAGLLVANVAAAPAGMSTKTMFVGPDALSELGVDSVTRYLKNKNIGAVVVYLSSNPRKLIMELSLIDSLKKDDLSVYVLKSGKHINTHQIRLSLHLTTERVGAHTIDGFNLDYEPYTIHQDDVDADQNDSLTYPWEGHETQYLDEYIDMLKAARKYVNSHNWRLSADIGLPFLAYPTYLSQIYNLTDEVIVMDYYCNISDVAFHILPAIATNPTKTIVGMSPYPSGNGAPCFPTKSATETFISQILDLPGVDYVAIYNLSRMLDLK